MKRNLADLIVNTPNWQTKSPEILLEELSICNIPYVDNRDWTWKGIADVINRDTNQRFGRDGCKHLQDTLKAAGEDLWVTQIAVGMPLTDPEIQGTLRYLDSIGIVPGARCVADAVMRNISMLEQHNITTTQEEVASIKAKLLLEEYKQSKVDGYQDRLQTYREAMTGYSGTGPEPEF